MVQAIIRQKNKLVSFCYFIFRPYWKLFFGWGANEQGTKRNELLPTKIIIPPIALHIDLSSLARTFFRPWLLLHYQHHPQDHHHHSHPTRPCSVSLFRTADRSRPPSPGGEGGKGVRERKVHKRGFCDGDIWGTTPNHPPPTNIALHTDDDLHTHTHTHIYLFIYATTNFWPHPAYSSTNPTQSQPNPTGQGGLQAEEWRITKADANDAETSKRGGILHVHPPIQSRLLMRREAGGHEDRETQQ